MSFISVVVGNRFISIVSDGRAIEVLPDGNYGKVMSENSNKFAIPTDKLFYSIVGMPHLAMSFIEQSNMVKELIKDGQFLVNETKVLQWYETNKYLLCGDKFGIAFGGESEDGILRVFSIDSKKGTFSVTSSPPGIINSILFPSSRLNPHIPQEIFNTLYGNSDGTIASTIRVQEELNDLIADIDITVNKNKTYYVIQKS